MKMFVVAALALVAPVAAHAEDVAAGKAVFGQCMACHVAKPGAVGVAAPNLYGVVGRKAASTGFAYSSALKASKLTWDKATLNTFLKAPQKLVPGTRMVIAVTNDTQRENVIAYLASLK
ncbi:c-type cytochrome [Novosphingobium sp.]|uniref:c-type cytochrome n=1 Tax=Novosphingobium sp. TaxID=1874826 RepID=UPI00333EE2C3